MRKFNLKKVSATLLMSVATMCNLVVSSIVPTVSADSYNYGYLAELESNYGMKVKNLTIPTIIQQGGYCSIGGTVNPGTADIRANANGTSVKWRVGIMVYDMNTYKNYYQSSKFGYMAYQNRKAKASSMSSWIYSNSSYDLKNLDSAIQFNTLPAGDYMYTIYYQNAYMNSYLNSISYREIYTSSFRVAKFRHYTSTELMETSYYNQASKATVTNFDIPDSLTYGSCYGLSADINILYKRPVNKKLNDMDEAYYPKSIRGRILNQNNVALYDSGKVSLLSRYFFGANERVYSVKMPSEVDYAMAFNLLSRGTYRYELTLYYYDGGRMGECCEQRTIKFKVV